MTARDKLREDDPMNGWSKIYNRKNKMAANNVESKSKKMSWLPIKKNKINAKESKSSNLATMQDSLRATLIAGQIFSLIPVNGVSNKSASAVRFSNKSWKCAYALASFSGQIFITFMSIYNVIYADPSLKAATSIVFYTTTCITMIMFYMVAKNWPKLLQHISKTEEKDPNFDSRLPFRCNVTCTVVLTLSLFEHILSLLSAFAGAKKCYPNVSVYEGFAKHFYPWVFNFLPYSTSLGILTEFLHFQATFIWNFSDLFVICMSYYLTSRLEQVNRKLQAAHGKYFPELFWRKSREEYCRATHVVRKVDDVISGIVFMSFANNLFFVCFQLFNTLDATVSGMQKGYEAAAYFFFSLVYLITRSVAVSLIAAQVNTASTVSAPVLYDVPSPVYCIEVQRFLDQISGDKVALSGLQFFSVTRGLLLTVAGTIVTYELVMVQFNSPSSPTSTAPVTFNGTAP